MHIGTLYYCFAVIFLFIRNTSGFPYTNELYEGSQCKLENGTAGICKKLPDCPARIADVRSGRRTNQANGRCSFQGFTEIVCCPLSVSEKIGVRPAEAACQEYENEVSLTSVDVDDGAPGNLSFHILGGTRALPAEFPYMVALGYENTDGEIDDPIVFNCGGTLISPRYVLTAAHCVSNINNRVPVVVRVGTEDLRATETFQDITVSNIITHPRYKRSVYYNDVALIHLSRPVVMSINVKPICLQTRSLAESKINSNTSFVVIGFGVTSLDFELSSKLMKTGNLSLVPKSSCERSYTNFGRLPTGLDDNIICAVDTNSTRSSDACQGDSGGPLLMMSGTTQYVVGVTSFGQSCGGPDPGIYTSVYSYLGWIEDKVWPERSKR